MICRPSNSQIQISFPQWTVGESRDSYQTLLTFLGWSIRFIYEVSKRQLCVRDIECTLLLWVFSWRVLTKKINFSNIWYGQSGENHFPSVTFIRPLLNPLQMQQISKENNFCSVVVELLDLPLNYLYVSWFCYFVNAWTQFWWQLVLMISKH